MFQKWQSSNRQEILVKFWLEKIAFGLFFQGTHSLRALVTFLERQRLEWKLSLAVTRIIISPQRKKCRLYEVSLLFNLATNLTTVETL